MGWKRLSEGKSEADQTKDFGTVERQSSAAGAANLFGITAPADHNR